MHTRASDAPFRSEFPTIIMPGQTDEQARHTMPHLPPDEPEPLTSQSVISENVGTSAKGQTFPTNPAERKDLPVCTGVLDYFPDAIAAVAACSKAGNDQHNPGEPLRWAREKSADHADCIVRHLMERGTVDSDGIRHSAKCAWRALALLQLEIEAEK